MALNFKEILTFAPPFGTLLKKFDKEGISPLFYWDKLEELITEAQIEALISDKIAESEFFVVDISVRPGNQILVEIDGPNGFPINECMSFSRQIEHNLDREVEDFSLEVSSPGLSKAFKVKQQFEKNVGRKVKIKTADNEKHSGVLSSFDGDVLTLKSTSKERVEGKKKKVEIEKTQSFNYSELKETRLVIEF